MDKEQTEKATNTNHFLWKGRDFERAGPRAAESNVLGDPIPEGESGPNRGIFPAFGVGEAESTWIPALLRTGDWLSFPPSSPF